MDDHEIELKLHWRHTWPDKEDDFVAEAPTYDDSVGRIYKSLKAGSLDHHWFWAMNAHGFDISRAGTLSGYEASPRKAAKAVEDAWFQAIRGSSHEVAPPTKNSYAAAKGRE